MGWREAGQAARGNLQVNGGGLEVAGLKQSGPDLVMRPARLRLKSNRFVKMFGCFGELSFL